MRTIHFAEYFHPTVGKWIIFYEGSREECEKHMDDPIFGNPYRRVAKYEETTVTYRFKPRKKRKLLSITKEGKS